MPAALRRSRLDARDRAYATDLAFGTIRHLRSIDWALDRVATRPVSRMSPGARNVLRLGGYQVLFTDTPQHAAVGDRAEIELNEAARLAPALVAQAT